MRLRISSIVFALCAPVFAADPSNSTPAAVAPAEAPPAQFQVKGTVRTHRVGSTLAVIAHEEIPGYMEAMTMPLVVKKAEELQGIKAGDQIQFRLNVTDDDCWIDQVKVTNKGEAAPPLPTQAAPAELKPLSPGQPFPDFRLTDHLGQPVTPADYRGQPYAITFIYTNCPLPTFCPLINRRFQETQQLISTNRLPGRLLSITIDPARDTVQHLRGFAESWKTDPGTWRLATGSLQDITALALQAGLSFWDEKGLIKHNLRTLVIDSHGKVHQVLEDGEWTPGQLSEMLKQAALADTISK